MEVIEGALSRRDNVPIKSIHVEASGAAGWPGVCTVDCILIVYACINASPTMHGNESRFNLWHTYRFDETPVDGETLRQECEGLRRCHRQAFTLNDGQELSVIMSHGLNIFLSTRSLSRHNDPARHVVLRS